MANRLSYTQAKQSTYLQSSFNLNEVFQYHSVISLVSFILCLALLFLPQLVSAKASGKEKFNQVIIPAQGSWFFNHSPDNAQHKQNTKPSTSNHDKQSVSLRKLESTEKIQYYAFNHLGGPVQLHLDFLQQKNISSNIELPADIILAPLKEQLVLEIKPKNPLSTWSFNFNYQHIPGDPNAVISARQYYLLPFSESQSFYVSQGFNGRFSHYSHTSRYAVDISMPEGTAIHSVSDGVIMDINKDFENGGTRQQLINQANVVRILHRDGSMAIYAHLQPNSVQVKVGQKVHAGEVIARSGNTGFSTGPHLHFAIEKNVNMKLESIPFKFLVKGKWLTPKRALLLQH